MFADVFIGLKISIVMRISVFATEIRHALTAAEIMLMYMRGATYHSLPQKSHLITGMPITS